MTTPDKLALLMAAIPADPFHAIDNGWCYSCLNDEVYPHKQSCAWVKAQEVMKHDLSR